MARTCVVCSNPTEGVTDWINGTEVPVCVPSEKTVLGDDGTHIPCVMILHNIRKSIQSQVGDKPNPDIPLELSTLGQILHELASRFPDFVVGLSNGPRDSNIQAFHWGERDRCHYLTAILESGLRPTTVVKTEF